MFSREKQAEERQKVLKEVLELNRLHSLLALQEATGTGKGLQVMKCIEEDKSPKKWLVIVPEVLQVENLKKDVIKHGMEHLYDKIEDVICYASFFKYQDRELNLWCNEGHRLSQLRYDILETIDYDRIIVDSATIPFRVRSLLSDIGSFHYFKLPLKEAIEREILPKPSVYIIPIELDDTLRRNETKYGRKNCLITDVKYALKMDSDLEYWKSRYAENPEQKWISGKLNSIGNERKKWFASRKTKTLKSLQDLLMGKRFICFCGSIEQCDEVGGNSVIHSKKGRKHNILTLDIFNKGEIDEIYLNKMGREGLNLEDINAAIITQLGTGSDEGLEFLQSTGRSLRSDAPEVYLPYIKGTKDEDFLRKALLNIDKQYIKELKL